MRATFTRSSPPVHAPVRVGRVGASVLRPWGRFAVHVAEMCVVMCGGAVVLSVVFFGAASLLGYSDLPQTAPALSVFVIALNLSVPMAAWMRFRGMRWRPTLEMAGSSLVTGVALIAAYWLGLVPKSDLIEIQTSLACPVMVAVMLVQFRLYSSNHSGHSARRAERARNAGQ